MVSQGMARERISPATRARGHVACEPAAGDQQLGGGDFDDLLAQLPVQRDRLVAQLGHVAAHDDPPSGGSKSRSSSRAARIAVGFELYASLIIVAPRISLTSQRIGTAAKTCNAAAISARSKPIIRPTAIAARAEGR